MNWAGIVAYAAGATLVAMLLGRYLGSLSVRFPTPPEFDRERAYRTLMDPANRPPAHPAPATTPGNDVRHND